MKTQPSRVSRNGSGGARSAGAEPPIPTKWSECRVICATHGFVCLLRDAPQLTHYVVCPKCLQPARVQNFHRARNHALVDDRSIRAHDFCRCTRGAS